MRRPRNELPPAGIYHVTTRGVARTAIFLADDERRLFLPCSPPKCSGTTGTATSST